MKTIENKTFEEFEALYYKIYRCNANTNGRVLIWWEYFKSNKTMLLKTAINKKWTKEFLEIIYKLSENEKLAILYIHSHIPFVKHICSALMGLEYE